MALASSVAPTTHRAGAGSHPGVRVGVQRAEMGLGAPLVVQYWHYVENLFTGDLGTSVVSQLPVSQIVSQRLPATLELALLAFFFAVAVAVPLGVTVGVLTRRGHGRRTELVFTTTSVVLGIIPDF